MHGQGWIVAEAVLLVKKYLLYLKKDLMIRLKILLVGLVVVMGFGCKEIYRPAVISANNTFLVIEGVLNAGNGPTNLRLTRTFKLDDSARLRGEPNAVVAVEGKDNSTRQLTDAGSGFYSSPGLNLTIGQEYRVRINTSDGKEYLSDYVMAKQTPPIDSLGWRRDEKGLEIYVNTHDPSNNTRYYRWDFDETWEIRSYYDSEFKYVNGVVTARTRDESVYACWKYDFSDKILLGSSASLESDNIYRAPLALFMNGDEKLDVRYSILARQYALDRRGYEFYELMRKNTESLGSIFDAQPSEQRGNFRCVSNPGELVIGYLSAVTIEEKRMFISRIEIPFWNYYQYCPEIIVLNQRDSIRDAYEGGGSIYGAVFTPFNTISHYRFSKIQCVECPTRGGSLLKPSYW